MVFWNPSVGEPTKGPERRDYLEKLRPLPGCELACAAGIMKQKLMALSRRYGAALQRHQRRPSRASLDTAQGLGRQAVAMGLETLDMARIHQQALVTSNGDIAGDRTVRLARSKRASAFFAEVINPIEETHLTAREAKVRLGQVNERLQRRTVELANSNRHLEQRIAKRKTAENALRQSREHQTRLLKESVELQQRLRRLTRRLLVAQEDERKEIGRGLRDEIAQTLLGINVRLLSLKSGATVNTKGLQKEITSTRQLVARSAKTMHRVARGFKRGS